MEFTSLHDLSLDYLLGKLVQHQEETIREIDRCVGQLQTIPTIQAIAQEALGEAKGHLDSLRELVAVSPDTGNWKDDTVRYAGLAAAFPFAVSCDFKARKLGPNGEHTLYDLKRCFEVGWKTGFHGPWCLEHANADRDVLFRELALLRDMLRKWMKESPRS